MRQPLAKDAADPTATTFALASQALG